MLDLLKIRKKTGRHVALPSGVESVPAVPATPPEKKPDAEKRASKPQPAEKARKPGKTTPETPPSEIVKASVALTPVVAPRPAEAKPPATPPPPAPAIEKSLPTVPPEPPPRSELRQAKPAPVVAPEPAPEAAAAPHPSTAPLHPPELPVADDALNRHLLCKVHQETFAVPISDILEILRERSLTPLPLTAPALAGILSLRGRMVPVVDAALRLGFEPFPSDENCRIVVFELAGEWIGLRVAAVGQVSVIDPDAVQHSAAALGETRSEITSGVLRISDQFVTVPVLQQLLDVTGA